MSKIAAVLFDLDLTLIASQAAAPFRDARRWTEAYAMIPGLAPYDGVHDLLRDLRTAGLRAGIVTSAPRTYAEKVVAHWQWQVDVIVGYHDAPRRKPNPDPIIHALDGLGVPAASAIYVGDHPDDVTAARAAGVWSVAASWGGFDASALERARPDTTAATVADLRGLLAL